MGSLAIHWGDGWAPDWKMPADAFCDLCECALHHSISAAARMVGVDRDVAQDALDVYYAEFALSHRVVAPPYIGVDGKHTGKSTILAVGEVWPEGGGPGRMLDVLPYGKNHYEGFVSWLRELPGRENIKVVVSDSEGKFVGLIAEGAPGTPQAIDPSHLLRDLLEQQWAAFRHFLPDLSRKMEAVPERVRLRAATKALIGDADWEPVDADAVERWLTREALMQDAPEVRQMRAFVQRVRVLMEIHDPEKLKHHLRILVESVSRDSPIWPCVAGYIETVLRHWDEYIRAIVLSLHTNFIERRQQDVGHAWSLASGHGRFEHLRLRVVLLGGFYTWVERRAMARRAYQRPRDASLIRRPPRKEKHHERA